MLPHPFDRATFLVQRLTTPFRNALSELLADYGAMLKKRPVQAFSDVLPQASWPTTWIWLIFLMSCDFLIELIASAFYVLRASAVTQARVLVLHLEGGILFRDLLMTPLSLVLLTVLQHWFARAWKGQGTFLEQCYGGLLFLLPLNPMGLLLAVVPTTIAGFPPALWIFFLLSWLLMMAIANISQLQAAHRLSDGQAIVIVVLTWLLQMLCSAWVSGLLTRLLLRWLT